MNRHGTVFTAGEFESRVKFVLEKKTQLIALGLPGRVQEDWYMLDWRQCGVNMQAVGKTDGSLRWTEVGEVEVELVWMIGGMVRDEYAVRANDFQGREVVDTDRLVGCANIRLWG
jgi:hypothetical protein